MKMHAELSEILDKASRSVSLDRASYWEIRAGRVVSKKLRFSNGSVRDSSFESGTALSARILIKGGWGFAAATIPEGKASMESIKKLVRDAFGNANLAGSRRREREDVETSSMVRGSFSVEPRINPDDVDDESVIEMMKDVYDNTKYEFENLSGRDSVSTVQRRGIGKLAGISIAYTNVNREVAIVNSSGSEASQRLVYTYGSAALTGKKSSRIEEQSGSVGFQAGFESFKGGKVSNVVSGRRRWSIKSPGIYGLAGALSSRLKDALIARPAKGGVYPVVADEELVDVLIHEAFGHAAEADSVLSGESCLRGMIGRSVVSGKHSEAEDEVSIVDDATMPGLWGSFFFDDEGSEAKRTFIVRRNILESFLHSRVTAAKMGVVSTGNARAESIGSIPVVRMSNTNLLPGSSSDEELFEGIRKGFFVGGSAGGQVDTAKGAFQFNASYGYLVENGSIKHPVKGVSLSGSTLEMLGNMERIGKKPGVGMAGFCGKFGQSVPVIGFNPKVRLSKVLVGGA